MPFPDREFRYQFLPVWRLQTSLTTALIFAATIGLALLTERPIQRRAAPPENLLIHEYEETTR